MNDEVEMARKFFGYGRWEAPYWFIGPEEGKGPKETADNTERVNTWVKLGRPDLCDCKEFHAEIGEENWHRELPPPPLQSTWRPLMLLLKTILNKPADPADLRKYQSERWGRVHEGETCVIELSGQAARGLSTPMDREKFREERVETICKKIREHEPKVVVMYGQSKKKHWERIAGCELELDRPHRVASTLFVFTTHPNTRGRGNSDWGDLGRQIREG